MSEPRVVKRQFIDFYPMTLDQKYRSQKKAKKRYYGRIRYLGDTSNFAPSPVGEGWDEGD